MDTIKRAVTREPRELSGCCEGARARAAGDLISVRPSVPSSHSATCCSPLSARAPPSGRFGRFGSHLRSRSPVGRRSVASGLGSGCESKGTRPLRTRASADFSFPSLADASSISASGRGKCAAQLWRRAKGAIRWPSAYERSPCRPAGWPTQVLSQLIAECREQ